MVISGDDGKSAGPGQLLLRGQGDLQEGQRLQLAGAAQAARVNGAQATCGDHVGEQRLGLASSPAIRTVVGRSLTVPEATVAASVPSGAACRGPARSADVNREGAGVKGLGEAARFWKEKNSPPKLTPSWPPAHSKRSTSIALIGTAATRGEIDPHRFGLTRQDAQADGH